MATSSMSLRHKDKPRPLPRAGSKRSEPEYRSPLLKQRPFSAKRRSQPLESHRAGRDADEGAPGFAFEFVAALPKTVSLLTSRPVAALPGAGGRSARGGGRIEGSNPKPAPGTAGHFHRRRG